MRVVVGYASAYGSTKGIAQAIGERLRAAGLDVDVRPVAEIDSVAAYDAAVLGSAIHNGAWLSTATDPVDQHTPQLASRPVWLFSVSSIGETSSFFGPRMTHMVRRMRTDPKGIPELRQALHAREHHSFAGAIQPEHWGRVGGAFLRLAGGSYGDHRDWADIESWAAKIARDLTGPPGSRPPPTAGSV